MQSSATTPELSEQDDEQPATTGKQGEQDVKKHETAGVRLRAGHVSSPLGATVDLLGVGTLAAGRRHRVKGLTETGENRTDRGDRKHWVFFCLRLEVVQKLFHFVLLNSC